MPFVDIRGIRTFVGRMFDHECQGFSFSCLKTLQEERKDCRVKQLFSFHQKGDLAKEQKPLRARKSCLANFEGRFSLQLAVP